MKSKSYCLGVAVYFCFVCSAFGASETIWQIGKFDQSSEEFAPSSTFASTISGPALTDPVFRVGKSDLQKDWSDFHPGSANGMAGAREHHFKIFFSLTNAPRGTFTLSVAILNYMPRRPDLRVEINGKQGMFFLNPKLSYDLGNFPVVFIPHYSFQQLDVDLPTSAMKQGENELVLTCVDDPADRDDSVGSMGVGISGIFYDALRLTRDDAKKPRAAASASLTPTIFYKQKDGQLIETVEAVISGDGKQPSGSAMLDVGGKQYEAVLSGSRDFGEQRARFEIPEWNGTAQAQLKIPGAKIQPALFSLQAAKRWKIFVVPHTHLDVGYTDYQSKVAEGQPRVLEQAAAFIKANPDFRFSMDASWTLEQLLETRSKIKQDEIIGLIRAGKMAVPAQYMSLLTGFASQETLIRSLYASKALARKYDYPFEYANITDIPSYTGAYPSILAAAGIRYFIPAGNNWRAPFLIHGRWNEKSPFWWEGPDGKKILVWYSRHYMQVQNMFGLPPSLAAIHDALPVFLQAYDRPDFKSDAALAFGTQVENTDLVPDTATFVNKWNAQFSYPHLQYATFADFMRYTEKAFGDKLPTYRGDAGPFWEDGVGADSYFAAMAREAQSRALSAEILASVTHSINPTLNPPRALVEDIWRNLVLFAEHTWTAWLSIDKPSHEQAVKQLEVKDHRATAARLAIDDLRNRSMSQLADQIHIPSNTLVVFNSVNWRRDALVEFDLLQEKATLRDLATGREVPYEVTNVMDSATSVRFLAQDIPAVGYKCYAINYEPGPPQPWPDITHPNVVENRFYRVTLDLASGAVASIFDKELQREIVDAKSPYKFGQYVYVSGGDGATQMIRPLKVWPRAEMTVTPANRGGNANVAKTPYGHSIRMWSFAPFTKVQSEIRLFDNVKKIEFLEHVSKEENRRKEGVYFAFPAAVAPPQFAYALQTGWVNAPQELLPGANAEWFSISPWMSVRDANLVVAVVPVDSALATFGDINRGAWPEKFEPKSSTLFSYVMNNYWDTNYRASQGGEFTFRYVVTSASNLDPAALARLAWEHLRPAEINYVMTQDKVGNPERPLPAEGASFLDVDAPNVVLGAWKLAEDGQGTILRFYETAGRETQATVRFLRRAPVSAELTNVVEDRITPLEVRDSSVQLKFRPNEIVTVRIRH